MAVALNTSHPLYANLVSLIGVDDDNVVKDFFVTGRTCTKHASASIGTGTYGRHVRTTQSAGDSQGVALSPLVPFGTIAAQNTSVFVVLNDLISTSGHSRAGLLGNVTRDFNAPTIQVNTSGQVCHDIGGSIGGTFSTGNILTGAHSVAVTRTHQTSAQLILNGNAEVVNYGRIGNTDASNGFGQIGGFPTGNWGAVSADFVWVATFDKVLSEAEVASLHSSLGASNAFGLVTSAANAAPTFPGPNIGNQTGTVGTALSANTVSDSFSDSDALTFSPIGSWPPGVTVSSAGIISGTPTTAGTYSTLQVRATDTAAQTVDSDVFSFTISAASHLITAANSQQVNTASSGSVSSGSGATITMPALKDWGTGNLKANETGITIIVNNMTTGDLVVKLTGETSDGSGVVAFTNAALVAATNYRVTTILADGSEGTWIYTAA